MEYESTMKEIIESSKLPRRIFYDLRGNHDSFGVPASGDDYDFYNKYSINAKLRRQGRVQSITLEVSSFSMYDPYLSCAGRKISYSLRSRCFGFSRYIAFVMHVVSR